MRPDGNDVVSVMDYKAAYDPLIKAVTGISTFRGVTFQLGQLNSRVAMTATCDAPVVLLERGQRTASFTTRLNLQRAQAAETYLGIKTKKYDEVIALLGHVILPPGATFYDNLKPSDCDENVDEVE